MANVITGTAQNDALVGTDDDDVILGLKGNDFLNGLFGNDLLDGGEGMDTAFLSFLNSTQGVRFSLASSNAVALTDRGTKTLVSIEAANIIGSAFDDVITGGVGKDSLSGAGGNDIINGGAGDDSVGGGFGDDIVDGGEGIDRTFIGFRLSTSPVHFNLVPGKMIVTSDQGTDTLISIEAATIDGSDFDDVITGGSENDFLVGYAGDDKINGGNGDDTLVGDDVRFGASSGNDTINGGQGDDFIDPGFGNDTINGGPGIDRTVLDFSNSPTPVNFAPGKNHIVVETSQGTKTLISIEAADLFGSVFDDVLGGGAYPEFIFGSDGNDTLSGQGGDDTIFGGAGRDTIIGGEGDDQLFGDDAGVDADVFVFGSASGNDTIFDFQLGTDSFRLSGGQAIAALDPQEFDTSVLFADGGSVLLLGVTVSEPSALLLA